MAGDDESASVKTDAVTGGKRIAPEWMLTLGEAVQQIQVQKIQDPHEGIPLTLNASILPIIFA